MPRVNLGRDPTKDRQEATRRIIRRGMAEQGITTQKELAEKRIPEMPAQLVPLIEEIWEEKVLH